MTFLLFTATIIFLVYRMTSADDRARYVAIAIHNLAHLRASASKPRPEIDRFETALRARTGRIVVTPALVAMFVCAFVFRWTGSVGPKTTNGEWWRIVTATFVQGGLFQLVVNGGATLQVGRMLERLTGRAATAMVFLAAGAIAGVVGVGIQPVAVVAGASGALFGLYGLVIAAVVFTRRVDEEADESRIVIPKLALRRLGLVAALVVIVNGLVGQMPFAAELAGLALGIALGTALLKGIGESTPPPQRIAAASVTGVIVAILAAWPLSGIADVRPEIVRVVAAEDRTASAYQEAVAGLNKGKTTPDAVAALIESKIAPELQAMDARLKTLKKVPPEHQLVVNDAEEFLRLRAESWRLRAETLRSSHRVPARKREADDTAADAAWRVRLEAQFRSNRVAIGKAEAVERSSLLVLERLKKWV